jgi:calcineurin-like phosphoesterase family protein
MKTYIISDTHFNHEKIKTYCDRPENFTEKIVHEWRQIVKPEDLIIHVGDVFIGPVSGWDYLYPFLPGRKVLVRGNHDKRSPQWWMEHGFVFACDAFIYRGAYITHKPSSFLPEGTNVNIHGHLHNVWDGFYPDDPEAEQSEFVVAAQLGRLLNSWQRLFAIEYTNYRPVEFDKFVAKPDKYQARGPNAETKKKLRLLTENNAKCSSCIPDGTGDSTYA